MPRSFEETTGGKWLVTQEVGHSVVNSCETYEDAANRARDLARQCPERRVTIYKAHEHVTIDMPNPRFDKAPH